MPDPAHARNSGFSRRETQQEAGAAILAKFFRGLGDPTRIRILELLLEGEKTVGELVDAVGSPQGRVSSHLACLRWCGYVTSDPRGRFAVYRVADERVAQLIELGRSMLADNAAHVAACARIDGSRRGACI